MEIPGNYSLCHFVLSISIMYLFQAADKIKIVFNPSVAVFIGKTNPRAENTCTEKMTLNIHWGLGIGSTNTEAASVSAQRGVLVSVLFLLDTETSCRL